MKLQSILTYSDDRKRKYEIRNHVDTLFLKRFHRSVSRFGSIFFLILSLSILLLPSSAIVQFHRTQSMTPWEIARLTLSLMTLVAGLPSSFAMIIYLQKRAVQKHKIACLSRSKCPACFANMRTQPIENDGCVLCPKCSAAWKITDHISQP